MYLVKPFSPHPGYPVLMANKPNQSSAFSRNLRRLRKERGLSQYDLAELTGLSQRMIHHYETHVSEPPLSKVDLIARALKVKASVLLEDPHGEEPKDASQFDTRSLKKLRDILELPPNDRSFLYRTLNNLVRKNQLERASRTRASGED
jgi:transcriptional regulator with XRE-family HTH domain